MYLNTILYNMDSIRLTDHAIKRMKRLTPSKSPIQKLAREALEFGIKTSEASGDLKKYIDSLYFYNKSANNIRIYHQKVFIFHLLD